MKRFLLIILSTSVLMCCVSDKEVRYHDNGQLKIKAELKNGKRDGLLEEYDNKGKLISKQEWKDGLENGEIVDYFKTDSIKSIIYFKNGKRNGESTYFYPDGVIKSKGDYENGKKVGEYVYYYENSNIETVEYYNEFGQILKYDVFLKDGQVDLTSIKPFFLSKKDTVAIGEQFEVEIRLNNQQFDKFRVLIGSDFDNDSGMLLDTLEVIEENKEGYCYYKFLPKTIGEKYINGIIQDVDSPDESGTSDTIDRMYEVPFRYKFYVNDK